jgi:ribosomal protein S12 methylthiotransferase
LPRVTEDSSVYAYLKIAEGCDNRCSYCAIPYIRGNFRSKPLSSLIDEAKELASRGKKEIIVIAQDITRYGQDLEGNVNLGTLLDELSLIDGIEWIRLMYLNPARVSHEFIDKVADNKKVLPYFDIPVQHINTVLLHSMNREAGSEKIYDVFGYIKEKMPNACLRTTFITGFPGETDEQHKEVLEFIKKNPIDNLGVFTFSEEEGTPAVEMENKVPADVAQKRADRIMTLQKRLLASRLRARRGEEIDVIIEGKKKGSGYYGRSFRDAPDIDGTVWVNTDKKLNVSDIVKVKITHTYDYDSEGELL